MKRTINTLFSTDVIAAVLSELPVDKKHLPTELRRLHPIFFKMSDLTIFNSFRFDQRGTFPYSLSVDQALSNLETAGVLPRVNPKLDRYEITSNLRKYYESNVKAKLTPRQKTEVVKVAHELSKIASN